MNGGLRKGRKNAFKSIFTDSGRLRRPNELQSRTKRVMGKMGTSEALKRIVLVNYVF